MYKLSDIENIRDEASFKDEIDACDILMFSVFYYIYGRDPIRMDLDNNALDIIEELLDKKGVVFVELNNGDIDGLDITLTHFFVLFKGTTYPIVLQSYCNRYYGKISEWPNWKDDLFPIINYNYGKKITYKNLNNKSNNNDRINQWNKIFDTDYTEDSSVPVFVSIYR